MKDIVIAVLLMSCTGFALAAGDVAGSDLSGDQAHRYHQLTKELRCLVCQNENIAESDADLAADLRHLVARKIDDGDSDDDIKSYLVDRYGDWVLYDPPFKWSTWLLWGSPFALLLLALIGGLAIIRGSRPAPASARRSELDEQRLTQILNEQEDHNTQDQDRSRPS